jgi:hypothetical protein
MFIAKPTAGTAKLRRSGMVRLKAHSNRRVKVPDLANTEGLVIESNCAGAITPGGEQLEMNEQSVTMIPGKGNKVNSIRSAGLASRPWIGEAHNEIALPAQREWNAAGGGPQMIGDGMFGSSSDVNQGTTAGGERTGRGQSPRSSEEAGVNGAQNWSENRGLEFPGFGPEPPLIGTDTTGWDSASMGAWNRGNTR